MVISGKGYFSTDAIQLLAEHNVNLILLDSFGNLVATMNNIMSSPTVTIPTTELDSMTPLGILTKFYACIKICWLPSFKARLAP